MSLNRPDWKHSWVEVVRQLNADLVRRLNSDAQPAALWVIDETQLSLSKPGALRIIWVIEGGTIERGYQAHGPDMPAPCVGIRKLKCRAEIRAVKTDATGIDARSLQLAEEILRALYIVWNKQRPADFDVDDCEEQWDDFTEEPGQREIICQFRLTLSLLILGDPHLTKQIEQIDSTGVIQNPWNP